MRVVIEGTRWANLNGSRGNHHAHQALMDAWKSLAVLAILAALDAAQHSLTVTLVWQALGEIETSYRVFVHLVDDRGEIVAQADGEPAQWARPTTGWAPQEFIVDEHILALPASLPPRSDRSLAAPAVS